MRFFDNFIGFQNKGDRVLFDPDTGETFSANAGDYWNLSDDHVFKNGNGTNFWLKDNAGRIIKKTVRKRDLRDLIYEGQKHQASYLNKRGGGSSERFVMRLNNGESYYLDGAGRISRDGLNFSSQWAIYGIAKRWNSSPVKWSEVKRNPRAFVGGYVYALDNSSIGEWANRRIVSFDKR